MEGKTYQSSVWSGGLLAISLVLLQGLLPLTSLHTAARIAVIAFAFALPILTCNILVNIARRKATAGASIQEILFYLAGMLAAFVGIGAAFWLMSYIATAIFAVSSLFAFLVYLKLMPSQESS